MKNLAASLAAALVALAPLPASSYVIFDTTGPQATVAAGQNFTLPQIKVFEDPVTTDTVALEAVGGCGTFGGATQVNVTVTRSGSELYGNAPVFNAVTPGFCKFRITLRDINNSDLFLDVYDPATLHVTPYDMDFPIVSVAMGESSTAVAARVVDAGGHHAGGHRVHYDPDARHCALLGGLDSAYESTSDAAGVATLPFTIPVNAPGGDCILTATLVENGSHTTIPAYVYDAEGMTMTASPVHSIAGQSVFFSLVLRDKVGHVLPNIDLQGRDVTYVGGPGLSVTFGSSTDQAGQFSTTVQTNTVTGRYEISILAGSHRVFRIPVVQSATAQTLPAPPIAPTHSLQDLWWAGPSDNGWGVSIVQHADTLFGVIYAYKMQGSAPTWYAIPGGTWDPTHTRYTGLMYLPHGTPFQSYDASHFSAQPSVGTATFIFTDNDHVTLDVQFNLDYYSTGRKALSREAFGSGTSTLSGLGDMWWGGEAQNGWGISILQQQGALFAVWYTYGADSIPTWYVMPTGTWTASDTFEGRMYSTSNTNGDWQDPYYEATSLNVNDVGPFRLRFGANGSATFDYTVGSDHGTLSLVRQPF